MAENKKDNTSERDDLASKHQSGLEGKTNTTEHSGKNVQFNSGSGGAKGEDYDGNSGGRNKPSDTGSDQGKAPGEKGNLESRTSTGFGKNPHGKES